MGNSPHALRRHVAAHYRVSSTLPIPTNESACHESYLVIDSRSFVAVYLDEYHLVDDEAFRKAVGEALANMPREAVAALDLLFTGGNDGKLVVRVSPEP